jgi:hypothetical protein
VNRFIRAVLEGEDAAPGRIAATDVARLLLGVQSVLRRAAQVVLGRPSVTMTDRYDAAIEDATRLRLVRIEANSFASVLALPDIATEAADLRMDVTMQDLGYRAFDRLVDVLQLSEPSLDPGLARAIGQLAEDVNVGGRVSLIRLETLADEARAKRVAVIDESTRRTMELAARQPERQPDIMVHGLLVEADFENYEARLRQPGGEAVTVTFDEGLADDIQAALRKPSDFTVDIVRPPGLDIRIELHHVVGPDERLALSGPDFHDHRTVAELALEQGVRTPQDLDDLRAGGIDADELAAFVAAAEQL